MRRLLALLILMCFGHDGTDGKIIKLNQILEIRHHIPKCTDLTDHTCVAMETCPGALQVDSHECANGGEICCVTATQCNQLNDHTCVPTDICPQPILMDSLECETDGEVCCATTHCNDLIDHACVTTAACPAPLQAAAYDCEDGAHTCCATTQCANLTDHTCVAMEACPGALQLDTHECADGGVCCATNQCSDLVDHTCVPTEVCPGNLQFSAECANDGEVCCATAECSTILDHSCSGSCDRVDQQVVSKFTCPSSEVCCGLRFVVHDTKKNFDDAKTDCENQNGKLAMFKNEEEIDLLRAALVSGSATMDVDRLWIGMITKVNTGGYEFLDATPVAEHMTAVGFLSAANKVKWIDTEFTQYSSGADCMSVKLKSDFMEIDDGACTNEFKYVCEFYDLL